VDSFLETVELNQGADVPLAVVDNELYTFLTFFLVKFTKDLIE
jgi:hypothetical protein